MRIQLIANITLIAFIINYYTICLCVYVCGGFIKCILTIYRWSNYTFLVTYFFDLVRAAIWSDIHPGNTQVNNKLK